MSRAEYTARNQKRCEKLHHRKITENYKNSVLAQQRLETQLKVIFDQILNLRSAPSIYSWLNYQQQLTKGLERLIIFATKLDD